MKKDLDRKAYGRLLKWKETSNGSTALLVNGARRVGKSHLVEKFGRNEYKSHIVIDFSKVDQSIRDIFIHDMGDLDLLFNKLSAFKSTILYERESLIVFDEVQLFPLARQMIKHLVADGRYDYIETGSLISIKTNVEGILIPSEEEHFLLHPLDFEEFLWAMGDEPLAKYLKGCFDNRVPVGDANHRRAMNRFREYLLVGGMPGVVSEYASTKDFSKADREKKRILDLYRADITKFARGYEKKVEEIFDHIPSQLSKKEKKFRPYSLGKNARVRTFEDAFMWLSDGMVVNLCFNSVDPSVGLAMNLDAASQKIYMADTGLLVTHSLSDGDFLDSEVYKSILLDKIGINEGMFMENVVAQALRAGGHKLYFYSRPRRAVDGPDERGTSVKPIEIDFMIRRDGKICPVEVKSSRYRRLASLERFRSKFGKRIGRPYVLHTKDFCEKDGVTYLPVYMAMFL